jgi:hypothetical protein
MSSQPEAPVVPCPATGRKRRAVLWLSSATFLLVLLGWFIALRPMSGNNLVWLTPAQLARATQAGPLTKLKLKVARLVAPLGLLNWRFRPNILTRSTLMTLTTDAVQRAGLPSASSATNADGTRVWILSAAELNVLQQRLKLTPPASVLGAASVTSLSGRQATVFVGDNTSSAKSGARLAGVVNRVGGSRAQQSHLEQFGLRVDLNPKYVSGAIKVMLGATATQRMETDPAIFRTNLAVACRAIVPNAGALLVDTGETPASSGTNYWLIVSPTAVDSRGNPL